MDGLFPLISSRRSYRAFSSRQVEEEKIGWLLEALRWAPSASNIQPWRIFTAQKNIPADWDLLFGPLNEGNKIWVQHASVLLLIVAETIHPQRNIPNPYAQHDCGLALQNILLQAEYNGLVAHPMAGFKAEELKKNLNLSGGQEPVTISAIGYHGSPEMLPAQLAAREAEPATRKGIGELLLKK